MTSDVIGHNCLLSSTVAIEFNFNFTNCEIYEASICAVISQHAQHETKQVPEQSSPFCENAFATCIRTWKLKVVCNGSGARNQCMPVVRR